jgi:hypothetical protein
MSHTGMHAAVRGWVVLSILLGSYLGGCYPNREMSSVQVDALPADRLIRATTKAYLRDASVVLFPESCSRARWQPTCMRLEGPSLLLRPYP